MLKQRIITAVILLIAFAALLGFASIGAFALVISLLVTAAAWEWSRLCGVTSENMQLGFAALVGVVCVFCLYSPLADTAIRWVMLAALLFWLSAIVQFYLQPVLAPVVQSKGPMLALGGFLLVCAGIAIQYLRSHAEGAGNALLLFAMAVVWVMDIGAYFSGRRFGKRKLAPLISPGKSWEGVYGGIASTFLLLLLGLLIMPWPEGSAQKLITASVAAAAISVVGDLYESRLKRAAGMKDSSQLLPGHGGVMDRLDGVIAALPVFTFFWVWM